MDLKAKYLSDTCSDPVEFLHQLKQTTEPIGGGTEYREDGELVEYDVAIEAVKKANDVFIERAFEFFGEHLWEYIDVKNANCDTFINIDGDKLQEDFRNYIKGE